MTNLEILLQDTYSDIIHIAENLEEKLLEQAKVGTQVSCALNLFQHLIQIMEIDRGAKEILQSVFCNSVYDLESQVMKFIV